MILCIKMHSACGQDHSSRVHFLLRRQALKVRLLVIFLQKLSVVQTTAGSFCFSMEYTSCKK